MVEVHGGGGAGTDANYNDVLSSPNYTWETGYGGEEQNGTYDMMGNVWEWCESAYDGTLNNMSENRVVRGGAYSSYDGYSLRSSYRIYSNPTNENNNIGFRVAASPD